MTSIIRIVILRGRVTDRQTDTHKQTDKQTGYGNDTHVTSTCRHLYDLHPGILARIVALYGFEWRAGSATTSNTE